jgi:hypothetical protein
MQRFLRQPFRRAARVMGLAALGAVLSSGTAAAGPFPPQQSSGSVGLQGTISTAAPTQGATITTPANGATFTSVPITVAGLCPKGLLVKVFSNDVFVGAAECTSGSYSIQVDLFGGENDLVTRVYDALDQAGPDSNSVIVHFNDSVVAQFGTRVALTSNYAKRGADPGSELDWPIILSGGIGPYAISVDWGDGSPAELVSEAFAGTFTIHHTYTTAGVYNVIVKATDSTGTEAFLQLVGVANGAIQSNSSSKNGGNTVIQTKVLWWPAVAMVPLILATFWVGGRHQLFTLRRELEKHRRQQS